MSTTWTALFDRLQAAAQRLAKVVEEMSGGRFRIEVLPGEQIMASFDCFDAASQGKIEAFMGSPQYWTSKEPAIEWFATIPFGMNPEGMAADTAEWVGPHDDMKLAYTIARATTITRAGTSPAPRSSSASTRRPTRRSRSICGGSS